MRRGVIRFAGMAGIGLPAGSLRRLARRQTYSIVRPGLSLRVSIRSGRLRSFVLPAAAVAVVAALSTLPVDWLLPSSWSREPSTTAVPVLLGIWAVDAALFVLPVAISALLVTLGTSEDERSWIVRRYRSVAFDWVAFYGAATLTLTGFEVMAESAAVSTTHESQLLSHAFAAFVGLVCAIVWLIFYSHRLLTTSDRLRSARLREAQYLELIESLTPTISQGILQQWANVNGLHLSILPAAYMHSPLTVRLSNQHESRLHNVRLHGLHLLLYSLTTPVDVALTGQARLQIAAGIDGHLRVGTAFAVLSAVDVNWTTAVTSVVRTRR